MFRHRTSRFILIALIAFSFCAFVEDPLKRKVTDFFFGVSPESGIQAVREQLSANPNFKIFEDPNRDPKTSVVGSIAEYKHLNKVTSSNQLIFSTAPYSSKSKEVLTITWLIDYKIEDLASALVDYEMYKAEFKPHFGYISSSREVGYEKEEIESIILKSGTTEITLKMTKGNNLRHSIAVTYKEVRKKKM